MQVGDKVKVIENMGRRSSRFVVGKVVQITPRLFVLDLGNYKESFMFVYRDIGLIQIEILRTVNQNAA